MNYGLHNNSDDDLNVHNNQVVVDTLIHILPLKGITLFSYVINSDAL